MNHVMLLIDNDKPSLNFVLETVHKNLQENHDLQVERVRLAIQARSHLMGVEGTDLRRHLRKQQDWEYIYRHYRSKHDEYVQHGSILDFLKS